MNIILEVVYSCIWISSQAAACVDVMSGADVERVHLYALSQENNNENMKKIIMKMLRKYSFITTASHTQPECHRSLRCKLLFASVMLLWDEIKVFFIIIIAW